jgi:tetratricopeptide (TPR) repeat protein
VLAWIAGDFSAARPLFDEALAFFRQIDDRPNIAVSLTHLGILAGGSGDPAKARGLFEESLAYYPCEDADGRRALTQCNLGTALIELGEFEKARRHLDEALAALQARGHRYGVSHALQSLAHLHLTEGRAGEARRLLMECIEILRELRDCTGIGSLANSLGEAEWQMGEPRAAAMWFGAAETAAERFGVPLSAEAVGKYEQCISQIRDALSSEVFAAAWREGQSLMQDWGR